MSRLRGRVVLLTGASRGIGRATALELARHGTRLGLAARSADQLDEVVVAARDLGAEAAMAFQTDVADEHAIALLDEQVASELGAPDVLINNAGLATPRLIPDLDADVVRLQFDVNVVGTMLLTGRVLRRMLERGSGDIVNIGSPSGDMPLAYMAVYGATKAALESFTRSLRAEVGHRGIRVAMIEVNHTETSFGEAWSPDLLGEMAATWEAAGHVRAAPVIKPADVARTIAFVLEQADPVEIDRISVGPAYPRGGGGGVV